MSERLAFFGVMRLAWVLGLAVVACVCAQTHAEKEAVEHLVPPQKASAHQHVPRAGV